MEAGGRKSGLRETKEGWKESMMATAVSVTYGGGKLGETGTLWCFPPSLETGNVANGAAMSNSFDAERTRLFKVSLGVGLRLHISTLLKFCSHRR